MKADNIKIDFSHTGLTAKQNKQNNKNLLLYGISCIVIDSCQKIIVVPIKKFIIELKSEVQNER